MAIDFFLQLQFFQIPVTLLGAFLMDRSGRRALLLVWTLQN
jgi:hypothetical protein